MSGRTLRSAANRPSYAEVDKDDSEATAEEDNDTNSDDDSSSRSKKKTRTRASSSSSKKKKQAAAASDDEDYNDADTIQVSDNDDDDDVVAEATSPKHERKSARRAAARAPPPQKVQQSAAMLKAAMKRKEVALAAAAAEIAPTQLLSASSQPRQPQPSSSSSLSSADVIDLLDDDSSIDYIPATPPSNGSSFAPPVRFVHHRMAPIGDGSAAIAPQKSATKAAASSKKKANTKAAASSSGKSSTKKKSSSKKMKFVRGKSSTPVRNSSSKPAAAAAVVVPSAHIRVIAAEHKSIVTEFGMITGLDDTDQIWSYLNGANWNLQSAINRFMDNPPAAAVVSRPAAAAVAPVANNSNGANKRARPAAAVASGESKTNSVHDTIINGGDDDDDNAAVISDDDHSDDGTARKRSRTTAAAAASKTKKLKTIVSDDDDEHDASSSIDERAPVVQVIPSWSRRLLGTITIVGTSTTTGRGILRAGDAVVFKRESPQQTKPAIVAAPKNKAGSAAAAKKKKMAKSKSKGKSGGGIAAAVAKTARPQRILRFTIPGASANSLELGSISRQKTADCLTPLFDRDLIDLEGQCIHCPDKVEIFTSIELAVSVYVRPALFTRGYATLPDHSAAAKGKISGWTKVGGTRTRVVTGIMVDGSGRAVPVDDAYNPIGAFVELLTFMGLTAHQSSMHDPTPTPSLPSSSSSSSSSSSAAAAAASDAPADSKRSSTDGGGGGDGDAATMMDMTLENTQPAGGTAATETKSAAAAAASSAPTVATPVAVPPADDDVDGADNDSELRVSAFQVESLYASTQSVAANIPELGQPSAMLAPCVLRRYQRQALYWMNARERQLAQTAVSNGTSVRHPLWDEYRIINDIEERGREAATQSGDAPNGHDEPLRFYLNPFNTQASLTFPAALPTARGGILADEMGMGKTVMCIALMLASLPDNVPLPLPTTDAPIDIKGSNGHGKNDSKKESKDSDDEATDNNDDNTKDKPSSSSSIASLRTGGRAAKLGQSTLVICPMSLISQWRDEIARFSDMNVLVYYGSAGNRSSGGISRLSGYDVVITSYGTLGSESRANPPPALDEHGQPIATVNGKKGGSPLLSMSWYRVICDEAHVIRNRSTETARAVFRLKASRRWCITGTPIQNRLDDVFALLHFLREDPWSDLGWWSTVIARPFEQGEPRALARLKAVLQTLMLRRTKDMRDSQGKSILDLPPRIETVLTLKFSDIERDFYRALFTRSKTQFEGFVSAGLVLNRYVQILTLLLRLRQCCDHPFLVLGRERSDKQFDEEVNRFMTRFTQRITDNSSAPSLEYLTGLADDIKKNGTTSSSSSATDDDINGSNGSGNNQCPICLSPPETSVLSECGHLFCRECIWPIFDGEGRAKCPICRSNLTMARMHEVPKASPLVAIDYESQWRHSAKTTRLMSELELLRDKEPTTKCVIFSQWTLMLDLLQIPLTKQGFKYVRLDGSLSQPQREKVLASFAKAGGATVMLISLKAGGVGLNLVSASVVYFLDAWWNPAVEDQAIQRVHRIGQTRTVRVYRFVVQDTIEEQIGILQDRKKHLAQSIGMNQDEQKQLRLDDLRQLFATL